MPIPPTFEPPYESVVEERFAWSMHKFLRQTCDFEKQVSVRTARGLFRIDFVITAPNQVRIGVEIDGRAFHDHVVDAWRDCILLGEKHIDVMIRFDAKDVHYRPFDTIAVIRYLYPEVFHPDRVIAIDRLASENLRGQVFDMPDHIWANLDDETLDNGQCVEMSVRHEGHTKHSSSGWRRRYAFLCQHPEIPLDQLDAALAESWLPK
jgi:hypothetical protein